jgi:hypothetical protein
MANRRDIKKDINFLSKQVINECFSFMEYSPVQNQENLLEILHDAEIIRRNLLYKVNHPPEDAKNLKNYYKNVIDELYELNIELIERINSISH